MPTPPAVTIPTVTVSGPLTITQGGTYTGNWSQVTVATTAPVTIEDSTFIGSGSYLAGSKVGTASDVTIRRCSFTATNTSGETRAVKFDTGFKRLILENCDIVSTAGCWFHSSQPTEVKIRNNRFRNVTTRNAPGGNFVQAVQFDKVNGGDVEIAWNEAINLPNVSQCEDVFNFFGCGGTSTKSWNVHDNLIWGAWPNPASSTNYTGGGIMHGDSAGGWIETHHNVILGTSNYGLSIVGGTGFYIHDNIVVGSGTLPDGTKLASSANGGPVGLAMWSNNASKVPPSNCRMDANRVGWWKPLRNARNDWWLPAVGSNGCTATGNTQLAAGSVPYSAEQAEYDAWTVRAASQTIGRTATATPAPPPPPSDLQAQYDALAAELLATKVSLNDATATAAAERTKRAALISAVDAAVQPYR